MKSLKTHWKAIRNEAGFTLTEMLIVIALIALVGSFAVSQIMSRFSKAKYDGTKITMQQLGGVLDNFKLDCGFYPTTEQGLEALVAKPIGGRECKNYDPEGYVKNGKIPVDGWGNQFTYASTGGKYQLISLGADAAEGGEGYDKDIKSDEAE